MASVDSLVFVAALSILRLVVSCIQNQVGRVQGIWNVEVFKCMDCSDQTMRQKVEGSEEKRWNFVFNAYSR